MVRSIRASIAVAAVALVPAAARGAGAPAPPPAPVRPGVTELVSLGRGGRPADGDSFRPSVSADGRLVAFESAAANLVRGDTNGSIDVFVRDRRTGRTRRVSVATGGGQATGGERSFGPSLSADGRFVAFGSDATNLVRGDTNGAADVFVHDLRTGRTERVSVGRDGAQADGGSRDPSISADGRFVAFFSDDGALLPDPDALFPSPNVFVRDRRRGTTERVSVGPGGAPADFGNFPNHTSISADGRVVAYDSSALNLAPDDDDNVYDIFVRRPR